MNDIMAAIGLAQFKKLPKVLKVKDKLRAKYNQALKGISWLETPKDQPYTKSGWWLYVARIKNGWRDKFMEYMAENGVTTSVHFPPVYQHSYFRKIGITAYCPVAENAAKEIVSLPLFASMNQQEFNYVVKIIKEFSPFT